jgi:phage gp46-like protein
LELLLKNGDYLPDGKGGFARVVGDEELLQRVLFKLTARRGSFPLMPRLGSRLFELLRHKDSQRESLARLYAAEALEDENDLTVEHVAVTPVSGGLVVKVFLKRHGDVLNVTVEV